MKIDKWGNEFGLNPLRKKNKGIPRHPTFKVWKRFRKPNSEQEAKECDASNVEQGTNADNQKKQS